MAPSAFRGNQTMTIFTRIFWQAILTFGDLELTEPQTFEELILDV
jgi:hypothetical protein